jgi:hypothetical protein
MDQDKYVYNKQTSSDFCVTDPDGRLRVLAEYGESVEIDNNIPPRRCGLLLFSI